MPKTEGPNDKPATTYPHPQDEAHRAAERDYWRRQIGISCWLNIITGVAAVIGLLGFVIIYNTLQVTQNQLTLAYPPQLRVTNFVVWRKEHPDAHETPRFAPGEEIEGFAWVVNYGRETAYIVQGICRIFWMQKILPMYRPYNDIPPNDIPNLGGVEKRRLTPGDIAEWNLTTIVPVDNLSLYIIGNVIYRDRVHTRRGIFFARRYDPTERRFVRATDNPDYESEE